MTISLATLLLCALAALAFAGVRALLAGRTTAFWIDLLSFLAGILVYASQSILGYKIAAWLPQLAAITVVRL